MKKRLSIKNWSRLLLVVVSLFFVYSCKQHTASLSVANYAGSSYSDSLFSSAPQVIPGKVFCAYYDLGGDSVAYYDSTTENLGSGTLNQADGTYLNEFRLNESVDISYTKNPIDSTDNNIVTPEMGMLYVGWTEPGEWINYLVDVQETGTYGVRFFFSAEIDGAISLSVDGKDATGILKIASTDSPHQWNQIDNLAEIKLEKGQRILTLHTVEGGKMNYAWLDFSLKAIDDDQH